MIGNDIAFGNVINMRSLKHEIFVVIQQLQLTILLSEKKLSIANHHILSDEQSCGSVIARTSHVTDVCSVSFSYNYENTNIVEKMADVFWVCKYIYVWIDVCSGLHVESITN